MKLFNECHVFGFEVRMMLLSECHAFVDYVMILLSECRVFVY